MYQKLHHSHLVSPTVLWAKEDIQKNVFSQKSNIKSWLLGFLNGPVLTSFRVWPQRAWFRLEGETEKL